MVEEYANIKDTTGEDISVLVESVINYIEFLSEIGCKGFDCSENSLNTLASWNSNNSLLSENLSDIIADISGCQRCRLFEGRKNIVSGAGSSKARLVFIGEGPGREEDKTGEPFVGAAGRLLTKIIQSLKLSRDQVYICNIIKCHPPGNRNPAPDEIKACLPFLKRQISVIKPDFICTLGTVATQALLNSKQSISKLRGRFYDYAGIKVMPTYHPAYLLRYAEKKRDVWEDMKKLIKEMKI